DLLDKGVFESALQETESANEVGLSDSEGGNLRGKFPDYGNRKIICLFCSESFGLLRIFDDTDPTPVKSAKAIQSEAFH
ncbi:Pebbled, partial [Caligus rogercresseyi]